MVRSYGKDWVKMSENVGLVMSTMIINYQETMLKEVNVDVFDQLMKKYNGYSLYFKEFCYLLTILSYL